MSFYGHLLSMSWVRPDLRKSKPNFYFMRFTGIDFWAIFHMKVGLIVHQKIHVGKIGGAKFLHSLVIQKKFSKKVQIWQIWRKKVNQNSIRNWAYVGTVTSYYSNWVNHLKVISRKFAHCTNKVLQTNFSNQPLIYISRTAKLSTFTWDMSEKSPWVLPIT